MELQKKMIPEKVVKAGWVLAAAGLVLVVLSYVVDPQRSSFNNLIFFMFLLSVSVGSLILIALEHLAGAVWSTPMRRVTEFIASTIPFVILLAVPLFLNLNKLFEWMHSDAAAGDHLLSVKSPYLNFTFFSARFIVIILIFLLFYKLFTRNSIKQDESGDQRLTSINVKLSAVFMPIVALGLSVLAIDWIMSLSPKWYSTIFGLYFISGTILAGLGATTFIVVMLNEKGYFQPALNGNHFYSLGALLFAFTNFWAYIAFSQFLLIWYANIPEETVWFLARWESNWKYISLALILIRFLIPYSALLSQPAKMDPIRLKKVALWILFSHVFDLYWLIMPNLSSSIIFGWMELGFPLLVTGMIIIVIAAKIRKHNLMPVGDPKLKRGLDFRL